MTNHHPKGNSFRLLRKVFAGASAELIHRDPRFISNASDNVVCTGPKGSESAARKEDASRQGSTDH